MSLNQVPQSNQTLAQTQAPILNNFITIDQVFGVDHVTFNTFNAGFHNKVTLPVQTMVPMGVAGAGVLYYYNNILYFNNNNTTPIPITLSNIASVGPSGLANGWTYLPSGFILKWGNLGFIQAGVAKTVNFPTLDAGAIAIPAFPTACVGALAIGTSSGNPNQVIAVQGVTATTITVYNKPISGTPATTVFFWAIGY
jgi:hypothetical protein